MSDSPMPVDFIAASTRRARVLSNGCRRSSVLATGSSIASGGTSDSDGCSAAESWMQSTSSSRAKSSHSSMARSGSLSRTSRGVNSWSAAVSTPIFMYLGSNARTAMSPPAFAKFTRWEERRWRLFRRSLTDVVSDDLAALHYEFDSLKFGNIGQRIAGNGDQVGVLAF